jgi:predicted DNA-binding transcriptional regulator YafY
MQHKSAIARYRIIDQCLRDKRKPFPTLDDLIDACSNGLEHLGKTGNVGRSTIQHDIQDLREGRAIIGKKVPIEYHKKEKGYYYYDPHFSLDSLQLDEEEWHSLRYAVALLNRYKDVPVFSHFKSAIERIDSTFELGLADGQASIEKVVMFEKGVTTTGYEWIYDIFYAIRESYLVEFKYENVYKKEKRRHRAIPYLLREFRNRWYMVVWSLEKEIFATYSLDRILQLQLIREKQRKKPDFDAHQFFADSLGVFAPSGKPQKIRLQIISPFDRLIQLNPLHPSQKFIRSIKNGICLELKVHITPELKNSILALGANCKVETPASLRAEMRSVINSMRKLY